MELDQLIFKKIIDLFKKKSSSLSQEEKSRTVVLDDIKGDLTVLSRVLTGSPLNIFPAEREGGIKGRNIFLPQNLSTTLAAKGALLAPFKLASSVG